MYTLKNTFVSFPLSRSNYKHILFAENRYTLTKIFYWCLLPNSFVADLFLYIPRKLKYLYLSKKVKSYRKMV